MQTEVRLKDGSGTRYALGLGVGDVAGHRVVSHGGEVSGFTAQNTVFPDDNLAIVVLTNQDAAGAAAMIAREIATLLLPAKPDADKKLEQARAIFTGLQHGKIDRSLLTDDANAYFTAQALQDFAASLGPLGEPQDFIQTGERGRGGMIYRGYKVTFPNQVVSITIYAMPDGKLEQYIVGAGN
jgi:hypothetical protein